MRRSSILIFVIALCLLAACGGRSTGMPTPDPLTATATPPQQVHAKSTAGTIAVLKLPNGEEHTVTVGEWASDVPGSYYGPIITVSNTGTKNFTVGAIRGRFSDGTETDKDYRGRLIVAGTSSLSSGGSTKILAFFSGKRNIDWIRYEVGDAYISFDG